MIKKIIVTGGNGRFGKELQKVKSKYKFTFLDKKKLIYNLQHQFKKILTSLNQIVFYI